MNDAKVFHRRQIFLQQIQILKCGFNDDDLCFWKKSSECECGKTCISSRIYYDTVVICGTGSAKNLKLSIQTPQCNIEIRTPFANHTGIPLMRI